MSLPPNIILIGFMGAGKTSVGKELAELLGFNFLDTDQLIEDKNGEKITKIFEEKGESFFRAEEKEVLQNLIDKKRFVLSTGGGIWLDKENRERLIELGWCVWLKVSAETAWQRISPNLSQRPLLQRSSDPFQTLSRLLSERKDSYSLTHSSFEADFKNPREIALTILGVLKEEKPFDLSKL
jgi:shikimate kinase